MFLEAHQKPTPPSYVDDADHQDWHEKNLSPNTQAKEITDGHLLSLRINDVFSLQSSDLKITSTAKSCSSPN